MKEVRIHTYLAILSQRDQEFMQGLNEKWAGENGVGGGRLLKLMEQHIMKHIRKHNLPCIWAVATKQSIILPFQKVKVTYLKIKVRIIKTNLEDIL